MLGLYNEQPDKAKQAVVGYCRNTACGLTIELGDEEAVRTGAIKTVSVMDSRIPSFVLCQLHDKYHIIRPRIPYAQSRKLYRLTLFCTHYNISSEINDFDTLLSVLNMEYKYRA